MVERRVYPNSLPPIARWTPGRKRELVESVRTGACELAAALDRYGIGAEEFERWCQLYDAIGDRGLKACVRFAGGPVVALSCPVPAPVRHWRHRKPRGLIG